MHIEWQCEDDEGVEHTFQIPAKHEVCDRCDGHGTHLNPSIGEHAYSREEFEEAFPEDEDKEQYFSRGGIYDVTCEVCDGKRVVAVPDFDVDWPAHPNPEINLKELYVDTARKHAQWDAENRHIRRMESGGYDY